MNYEQYQAKFAVNAQLDTETKTCPACGKQFTGKEECCSSDCELTHDIERALNGALDSINREDARKLARKPRRK